MLRIAICLLAWAVSLQGSNITIDYPAQGSLFPPEIIAPTFLWRDSSAAKVWRIEVAFGDSARALQATSAGERMPIGEIDERCAKAGAVPPTLTPLEAEAHSWKPDEAAWTVMKRHSVKRAATVRITGFADERMAEPLSSGQVAIRTSSDPVGAPLFYRDVPLIPFPQGERGVIMPLPREAIPFIAWRLLYIGEPRSKVMMEGLPTCANCHSFSRDGRTLGLDVDGPQNDKGLYGLVPVKKVTYIRNEDVIQWSSFADERASKRFGFMSQISPDGQCVVTSIENPGSHVKDFDSRLFNGFYNDYGFGQVFYPTRGVLAWYSRASGKLRTLPGADDPRYVQTSAFWSPDGKYLIFSRAEAKDPYYTGQKLSMYANDPNETQIQYDLYRIPFNQGRGGEAEPIVGASQNGMSNNFPKVSPDGKWIVFVENKNGLLMRPDSKLYIVPFQGGQARPLDCNTPRMNSWHSFSPNGRWLVFSSKGRSLYTELYLTHLDENGHDTPAIRIENATATNRAVNIPEFANIPPGGLEKMESPAVEFYRLFDVAAGLTEKGKFTAAVEAWKKAMDLDPEDAKAHYNLGLTLDRQGELDRAIAEYRKSVEINPLNASAYTNLGVALTRTGKLDEAVDALTKSVAIRPANATAQSNLAAALIEKGQTDEAVQHIREALEANPEFADAHNMLGIVLARAGKLDEAISHLEAAVANTPDSLEYHFNLGRVLAARGRFADATPQFEQAVTLSNGQEPQSLEMLAAMYSEAGRFREAAEVARRALELAVRQNNTGEAQALRARIESYEARASGH